MPAAAEVNGLLPSQITMSSLKQADALSGHVSTANGVNGSSVEIKNGVNGHTKSSYSVTDEPIGTIRPVRIITIGAGASGINMAYQAKKHLKNTELVIYEKNPEIGGTWFENRYPGCKCDIPSHNYQFTWEPNPNWSELFSSNFEIEAYLKHCMDKYGLSEYIKLSHRIVGASWDEQQGIWNVKIEDIESQTVIDDWCHFLLNAGGILNNWKWPDIPGLHSFKGSLIHSANWPEGEAANLKGKTVAVIGNGSTGIQIVPSIQPEVKQLIHLIRSPTWVTPGAASRYPSLRGGEMPTVFSEEQKETFRNDPETYEDFRKQIEREINSKFRMLVNGAKLAVEAKENAHNSMMKQLGDKAEEIGPKIIPDFSVGCRRITPGVGYLECFSQPNVRVITQAKIDHVEERGIVMADGELLEIDALVCATGFDVSFSPRFPITGRNGLDLATVWKDVPRAYLSLAIPDFPNYFMFLGPNAPISHGSIFTITENVSKYIMQLITKAQTEMIKSINVKQDAVDDFTQHIEAFMPRTAWAGNCRSWFKRGQVNGPVTAIHPGSRVHWFHTMERPKFEDFNYEYVTGNRFQYLGNGFSIREEEGGDNTWYLDHVDPQYLYY